MQKIYVFFFVSLVILLGGLNFGLYKYNEEDKQDFYQQLCDKFVSSESYRGIGYLTKDFDPSTGEWSLDWIKTESFGFDDEQKTGIIIQTVQLEPSILKGVDGKRISYMAYEFVTGPSTTPDSPFMLHEWTYTTNPPDIESILATKSSFYKLEKDDYAIPFTIGGGQIIYGPATMNIATKAKYVRTPNGNFLVLLIFANVLFILIYSVHHWSLSLSKTGNNR